VATKLKPNINLVEVHPQLSNKGHPVATALVGVGSTVAKRISFYFFIFFLLGFCPVGGKALWVVPSIHHASGFQGQRH
jgi:hypothetical protein